MAGCASAGRCVVRFVIRCTFRCTSVCAVLGALAAAPPVHAAEKTFELALTNGTLPAARRSMRVEQGDVVRWRIVSDGPGELHLHAYRVEAKLAAGVPVEVSFKAFATGRFRLEWHASVGKTAEQAVPPGTAARTSAHHHAPPLATLDVRPR